ncbi:MAG TPA: class I SAM-dependent methyltransferase, partial [Kofleriaceae bacterium]|nr:class I SAM-dependent methyltransferase [Kofleriaceae bacterium]
MTKRDDDSQADMEVGMTTAERRRRRRRGAGLRVPSDNVPRRASTPPVVAPVPEDPSLAMSIAYSFGSEPSEPMTSRTPTHESVPSFEHHEGMPTVIDPVSGPIEQADFEMKTREMTAIDLEELGLSEAGSPFNTLPLQRLSAIDLESGSALASPSDGDRRFIVREATDPADDVEVDLDASVDGLDDLDDGIVDPGATLDQDAGRGLARSAELELDGSEPTTIHPGPPVPPPPPEASARAAETSQPRQAIADGAPRPVANEGAQPRPAAGDSAYPRPVATESSQPRAIASEQRPAGGIRIGRAQTVALSEDDLEEVREAARMSNQPALRPTSMSIPPPMPPVKQARPRSATPSSVPEIDIQALEDRAAEAPTEFEVDVDGIVDAKPVDDSRAEAAPAEPAEAAPPVPPAPPAPLESRTRSVAPPPSPHSASIPLPIAPAGREPPPAAAVHAPPPPPPPPLAGGVGQGRDSQPMSLVRDGGHAPPPPPPALHKGPPAPPAPPAPPLARKDRSSPALVTPISKPELRDTKLDKADGKPRGKPWFIELFDEDYLRTLPFLTPQATQAEAEFVIDAMGLTPGAQVLDVGCGYGRHAMELAARGFHIVGLDLSTPLLVRGGEEAHRRGLTINFVRGDMRELDFDSQFDGAYCLFSTFGYFDDETNKKTVSNIARALRPGGRMLIEILNRDYVIADLPTRVWWEGDGCVVLEEVELNYFSSRIQVNRSVVFDDGRQLEQEISVRAYSLHEVGKLMHSAGLRVLEVSGAYHTRGRFFGNQSR